MSVEIPAALVQYLREKRCVLFCGSGLSAWAGLPTWQKLLEKIVERYEAERPDDGIIVDLKRLLQEKKLLELADHCKEALGHIYSDIMSKELRGKVAIPEPHRIIMRLPFAAIVTTNYDKLLERAYADETQDLPRAPTQYDIGTLGPLLFDGGFFILKAHGDIDRPETMVLTTRDFQRIIHAHPAFDAIFSGILLTKAVLFIGYSLNDPDFRLLLDRQITIFGSHIPNRYALMAGISKVEKEILKRTAQITVLSYEDHDGKHGQMLEFLRRLHEETGKEQEEGVSATRARTPRSSPESAAAVSLRATPSHAAVPPSMRQACPLGATLHMELKGDALEATLDTGAGRKAERGHPIQWAMLTRMMPDAMEDLEHARALGTELAKLLPPELLHTLQGVPAGSEIMLWAAAEIELLPWEMMQIGGEFLSLRNPLVRVPIAVSDTARGYPVPRRPMRVLLVGDPNEKDGLALPFAAAEVREIAKLYEQHPSLPFCDSLIGPNATFEAVSAALSTGSYDVVHFAGHAWFEEDGEPFLKLSKFVKLRSSELRSLISPQPPALLILNSHCTSFVPPGITAAHGTRAAKEAAKPRQGGQRGFTQAAASAGVGVFIGSFSPELTDDVAWRVGVGFHEALLRGEPAAQALHQSLVGSRPTTLTASPSHVTYSMSGYGDMRLPI